MLESNQIQVFCHLEDVNQIQKNMIFQNRRRPQGKTLKMENRDFSISTPPTDQHYENWKSYFFKTDAAQVTKIIQITQKY